MKLELKEVSKSFGRQVVFNRFDMVVESGEMVAISGKSGSGKTTLINMLGLIEKPDSGAIFYGGQQIEHAEQRRKLLSGKIGFVFQNFGLIENETVYENLAILKKLSRGSRGTKRRTMLEALEKTGLNEGYLDKKVYECSGGEQQRIAIAKILIKDCEVIFADEPTASLDSDNKLTVMSHLKDLHNKGKTIVIVSHDHEVCANCDRVITI